MRTSDEFRIEFLHLGRQLREVRWSSFVFGARRAFVISLVWMSLGRLSLIYSSRWGLFFFVVWYFISYTHVLGSI